MYEWQTEWDSIADVVSSIEWYAQLLFPIPFSIPIPLSVFECVRVCVCVRAAQ